MKVTCQIQKYDVNVLEAPFQFINLWQFDCEKPEVDKGGSLFAQMLRNECKDRGYEFRFYTISRESDITYNVVVMGEMEETSLFKAQARIMNS